MLANTTIFKKVLARQAKRLNNPELTLLCNNCIGGIILHDAKQKFNTPTINLYFNAPDYIRFLERLEYYLAKEITFSYHSKYDSETKSYPIGKIEDIEMHFVHDHEFGEAKAKWETRAKRVNIEKLFIIGSDRGYFSPDLLERFLKLPYKNKIFFSSKKHPAKEVIFFREYANKTQVADLIQHDHAWYFHFDTFGWLNTGEIKRYPLLSTLFNLYRFTRKKYQRMTQHKNKKASPPLGTDTTIVH